MTPAAVIGTALRDFHASFAWVVVIGNGLAGLWALSAHWVAALRRRALWWYTIVAEVAVFVQVILGVSVMQGQDIEPPEFHLFYGFVAIIAIGILYSYRAQMQPHRFLLYGGGGLFLMGLGIRAMLVGAG
ncbi:MAG: hypothetical protein KDB21_20460 [Acidimicrobiales bacterium]|nr:hypothetical protein [Acidimicrobiales bacterium]